MEEKMRNLEERLSEAERRIELMKDMIVDVMCDVKKYRALADMYQLIMSQISKGNSGPENS